MADVSEPSKRALDLTDEANPKRLKTAECAAPEVCDVSKWRQRLTYFSACFRK